MEAFANLSKIDDVKLKQRYRDSLLEYCKLDTLAMVKILEKLKESLNIVTGKQIGRAHV